MPRGHAVQLRSLPLRKADFIEPMDCAPIPKLIDGPGWVYEIKLDGYRAVGVKSDGGVNLFSRRHKSFNHQYPYLVEALSDLPRGTVVDGEIVALDESGRPHFNLLQSFRSEASCVHYFIFDMLICDNRDLTRLKLSERRQLMKPVNEYRVADHPPKIVGFSPTVGRMYLFTSGESLGLSQPHAAQQVGVAGVGAHPVPEPVYR